MTRRLSAKAFLAIVVPATLAVAVLALLQGYRELTTGQILQALAASVGLAEPLHPDDQTIVLTIRLPRILIALFGGAALAIAGTIMQAVFRNPLASPEILGTSQGAALGATVAIGLGWAADTAFAQPACAVVGALAVTALVYYIAGGTRGLSVGSLLLAGIAMNTLVGALIAFAISYLSYDSWGQGSQILFWLMGSFDKTMGVDAVAVAVSLLLFSLALLPFLRDMDLMTLKDQGAAALGVNVVVVRSVLLVIACALTAVTVAFTGGIAFVGLVVPHMARLVVGPAHRSLVPCAAVLGSFMLLLSDYVCRVLVPNSGLRVGVVMAMLGAPFFLYLLIRLRRGQQL
jgi:iron complex transport system permease protein